MKSTELRIGNWIEFEGNNFQVTSIEDDTPNGWYGRMMGNRIEYNLSNFKPIPLTEEWLVKFDWKNRKDKDLAVSFGLTSGTIHFVVGNYYKECYTVHQLQNLYFALTGEELTIKELA